MFSDKIQQEIEIRLERMLCFCGSKKRQSIEQELAGCRPQEAECVKALYASMPLSDCLNYEFEVLLDYAVHGAFLWENGAWKNTIPEELFLNDVLHYRINEEDISPCRSFFYQELQELIRGLSMREAALAVNYWCAGEATYQSTDDRTVSPMTVYRSALGRCGEESTFTVSALRSVGLPARQVYAPRWSHCDDNHAWVEVWCDGAWYFMGACEPEVILNKGWFPGAASRAMLIHSRSFFPRQEAEGAELIGKDGMVFLYNETARYALTKRFTVQVNMPDGSPAEHARVDFEILNYAELFPVASVWTNAEGEAALTLGLGSIRISAFSQGISASRLADVRETESVTMTLEEGNQDRGNSWVEFDMTAPSDALIHQAVISSEQKEAGRTKLQKMTANRLEKQAIWEASVLRITEPQGNSRKSITLQADADIDKMTEIRLKAKGNLGEIERFLTGGDHMHLKMKEMLLDQLTQKDYRDVKAEILQEHLESALPYQHRMEESLFVKYVLNPRIGLEPLSKYRRDIEEYYSEEKKEVFRKNPELLWEELKQRITFCPEMEFGALLTLPSGCLRHRMGSMLSVKILCIAVLRTLGVPSHLNAADDSMEYFRENSWFKIGDGSELPGSIRFRRDADVDFNYLQNFTIAVYQDGTYKTLQLGGSNWEEETLFLPSGRYRVLTANRLPSGSQFAAAATFILKSGETTDLHLLLREAKLADMLECMKLPDFIFESQARQTLEFSKIAEEKKGVLLWLEEGKEPTEHILNELFDLSAEFNALESALTFFVRSEGALSDPAIDRSLAVLTHKKVYYDSFAENRNLLGRRMYVDPEKLPLIIVTQEQNGIYAQSGYNVGTADMLLRILKY